jgi:hypothetical protein
MANIRKMIFGSPPFSFVANHLAQDKDFIDEAKILLKLEQDEYLRLSSQLNKSNEFLSRSVLAALVGEVIGDSSESKQVVSILGRLASILHGNDITAEKSMDELARAIGGKASRLKVEERRILTDRIRSLVVEPTGFARQQKAQELAGVIGAELDEFRLICDIRPIFDKNRERIEGAMPVTVFQMEYSKADGESNVIEVRVTERQLEILGEKFADARRKLKLIADSLALQHIQVPTTETTDADKT